MEIRKRKSVNDTVVKSVLNFSIGYAVGNRRFYLPIIHTSSETFPERKNNYSPLNGLDKY